VLVATQLAAGAILFALDVGALAGRYFAICLGPALAAANASLVVARLCCLATGKFSCRHTFPDAPMLYGFPLVDARCGRLGPGLVQTDYRYESKKDHHLFHVAV